MKILLAGGTGQLGQILEREYRSRGYNVTVLTRKPVKAHHILWDGKTVGEWSKQLEGLDLVINLAGKSIKCRHTKKNLEELYCSRIDSTKAIGWALQKAKQAPKLWIQMSTAGIYSHCFEGFNDEFKGKIGVEEGNIPENWKFTFKIAKDWEKAFNSIKTEKTRKTAVRMAFIMSPDKGGFFSICSRLSRIALGGSVAGGKQFISWIHDKDFISAMDYIIQNEKISSPVNFSSPYPLPQKDLMKILRKEWAVPLGLPITKGMAEIGSFFLRIDTELILKSSKVIPKKLLDHGFKFKFPKWGRAAQDLVRRYKKKN